jgi:nitrate/nitrite-specific signal transduction histidine kinase
MKKQGKIEVNIVKTVEEIKFTIEDNGIGINQSLEQKKSSDISHDSRGMMITSSRINVLRKITKRNIQIFGPFEMQDKLGNSIGTKVEIVFPIEKNTTFSKKTR